MRRALALALLAVSACAAAPKRPQVVWPSPPDVARIRFEASFAKSSDLDQSTGAAILRVILGGDRDVALGRPMGLALSPDGRQLYVADPGRGAVFAADFTAKKLTELAGPEVVGNPFGVAVDADGLVYVSDQAGKRVVVLNRLGALVRVIGAKDGLVRPSGVAVDPVRRLLYVADPATLGSPDHRVLVFSLEGALEDTLGKGKGSDDGQFFFPVYVAVDQAGQLFVSDVMNFRVQVFSPGGRFVRKYGEHGDGPGAFARLKGLAFDSLQNLYVVDGEHAVVQLFNPDFQELMFFGGAAPFLESLELPSAIAIDPKTNRIYVANEVNARVNVYQLINTRPGDASAPPPEKGGGTTAPK